MKKVAAMVDALKARYPRIVAALTFERTCLATTKVVNENIRVTKDLIAKLEAAQDSIATLYERRNPASSADDCEYVAPTPPRRRSVDRW